MAEFNGFRFVLELEAQMPLIHFQSGQCGATLRATEMKPKLDAFLLAKLEKETGMNVSALKKLPEYSSLFLNADAENNDALDYKVQITVQEAPTEIDLGKVTTDSSGKKDNSENYSLFYGNMGKAAGDKVYGIFSNPTVTILCFKEKLRRLIEDTIVKFFLVTNFGTMQDKGFGSFIPKDWCQPGELSEAKKAEVAKAYRELIPNGKSYAMVFPKMPTSHASFEEKNRFCVRMAETIKSFYSMMKSGANFGERGYSRSYIYQYGHEVLGMGNEKAWMKKNQIAPIVFQPGNEKKHEFGGQNYRYLRAFLGIGEQIEYGSRIENGRIQKKPAVKVSIKSDKFERMSSPIYFKVIRDVVFIVAFDVPEELYGASFKFSSSMGSGSISVPKRDELNGEGGFDIQDFLSHYVAYYNGALRDKISRIKNQPKVEEVKINA